MNDELTFLAILTFDVVGIAVIWAHHKNKSLKKLDEFKDLVKNSVVKDYLNDNALDRYVQSKNLKYKQVIPILLGLINELEQDENFCDKEKLALLQNVTDVYIKTGLLSDLPVNIRLKMRAIARLNPHSADLVYQLAQDINALNFTNQCWKRAGIVTSIIASTIALWGLYPVVISFFKSIFKLS